MTDLLRRSLIRLAHAKPELRPHLLPLLRGKTALAHGLAVGDILSSMWGYDQTNVDFYQVVGVAGQMTVVIRKIGSKIVGHSTTEDSVMPVPGQFVGPSMRRRVRGAPGKEAVSISSYANAYRWDGKPEWATNPMFGH